MNNLMIYIFLVNILNTNIFTLQSYENIIIDIAFKEVLKENDCIDNYYIYLAKYNNYELLKYDICDKKMTNCSYLSNKNLEKLSNKTFWYIEIGSIKNENNILQNYIIYSVFIDYNDNSIIFKNKINYSTEKLLNKTVKCKIKTKYIDFNVIDISKGSLNMQKNDSENYGLFITRGNYKQTVLNYAYFKSNKMSSKKSKDTWIKYWNNLTNKTNNLTDKDFYYIGYELMNQKANQINLGGSKYILIDSDSKEVIKN